MFTHYFLFIYLFLALLRLCCCIGACFSCSKRGLLFAEVHGLLIAVASRCRAWPLRAWVSVVWHMGLVPLQHVGSSWTRDQTHVPRMAGGFLSTAPPRKPSRTESFWFLPFPASRSCSWLFSPSSQPVE